MGIEEGVKSLSHRWGKQNHSHKGWGTKFPQRNFQENFQAEPITQLREGTEIALALL